MKNNLVTNILLIVVAIFLIFNLIPKNSSNRYSIYDCQDQNLILKLDKQTGRLFVISYRPSWGNFMERFTTEYEIATESGGKFIDALSLYQAQRDSAEYSKFLKKGKADDPWGIAPKDSSSP